MGNTGREAPEYGAWTAWRLAGLPARAVVVALVRQHRVRALGVDDGRAGGLAGGRVDGLHVELTGLDEGHETAIRGERGQRGVLRELHRGAFRRARGVHALQED